MQSYPLIGLDKDRNEHPFEFIGTSPRNAAEKGGEKLGYIEVLSGDQSSRRNGRANGIYYKQSLFKCMRHEHLMGKAGPTSLALSMAEKLNKSGAALLQDLRNRGLVPTVMKDEDTGEPVLHIGLGTLSAPLTPEVKEQLRVEIEPNERRIIKALQDEAAKKEPRDPYKGQGRAEVMRKILPQMPMRFNTQDFVARLKAADYIDFAEDMIAVRNGLTHAIQVGDMIRITKGQYAVAERLRTGKRKPECPTPITPTNTNIPVENIPEPKSTAHLEPVTSIPVEKVSQPAPSTQTPEPSLPKDPAPKDKTIRTQVIPTGMFETLFALATQAIAVPDDGEQLAATMEEAVGAFETKMLEAVSTLTTSIQRGVERIRAESQARNSVRQLTRGVTEHAQQMS